MSHPNPLLEGISDGSPVMAPSDDTNVKRPTPPRPNTIRSLDQSDLDSTAANPLLADIDTPTKNPLVSGIGIDSEQLPSPNHVNNEIALNLLSLTQYASGGDALRRRANMLLQISQVPEGSFKNAVFKATNDIVKSLNDIFERTPLATVTSVLSGKKSVGDIADRYKQDIKSSAKGAAGLAEWGFGAGKGFVEKGPVQGTQDFIGSTIHSFITDPVNRVFGAGTGVDAATGTVLSPEERADDVKFTAALAATSFSGKYINTLLGEGITEVPLLSQGGAKVTVPGRTLGKRFGIGALEGAASGTIFGAISRAGAPDSDYFSGIVTDALMFGSFGSTLNMLAGKRPTIPENMDAMAMATRMLQTHENSTLAQVANNTHAVMSSQNIIEAAIKGQIVLDPNRAHIFTGLKDGREIMDALGKGANIRSNGKGGWDLLYIGDELRKSVSSGAEKLDVEMWHRTGFMSGQTVSLGGHEYKIVGEGGIGDEGVRIKLQDKSGVEIEMPASALRNIPGSEFRGRNQAAHPNTLYSGVAYRGTRGSVDPLEPGHLGNTFMSEDPVFATIHSDKGGAVHRIEYKFKNPKQIPQPPDIATRQDYIRDQSKLAYEEGHDGLFIGELGDERLEIIDVTNDKTGLKVKERVDRSMMDADDVDFYMKEIKPRMEDGMNFHEATLDALGLTPEEVARVKSVPESELVGEGRVKVERGFEKNNPFEDFTVTDFDKAVNPIYNEYSFLDLLHLEKFSEANLKYYDINPDEGLRIQESLNTLRQEIESRGGIQQILHAYKDKSIADLQLEHANLSNKQVELNNNFSAIANEVRSLRRDGAPESVIKDKLDAGEKLRLQILDLNNKLTDLETITNLKKENPTDPYKDFKRKPKVEDTRTDAEKAVYKDYTDFDVILALDDVRDVIKSFELHGHNYVPEPGEYRGYLEAKEELTILQKEAEVRNVSKESIVSKYNNLENSAIDNIRSNIDKELGDLYDTQREARKLGIPDDTIVKEIRNLNKQSNELGFVLRYRENQGSGPMIEFKRNASNPLTHTKVLDEHGNAKIVYHGTSRAFNEFDLSFDGGGNLMGPGLYFTEDPFVASSYTKKNGSDIRDIEQFIEGTKKVKEQNLAKLVAAEEKLKKNKAIIEEQGNVFSDMREYPDQIESHIEQIKKALAVNDETIAEYTDRLNKTSPNVIRVKLDIRNPFDADKYYTLEEANKILEAAGVEDLWEASGDPQIDSGARFHGYDDIIEKILQEGGYREIPKALKASGFDGITHQGGIRIGNKEHRVWIVLDESQVHPIDADLIKIERRSLDYVPPKAGIESARALPAVRLAQRMELIHNLVGQSTEPYAMVQHAGTNGFIIDPPTDGGMTVLRDAESGIHIGSFTSAEAARDFINASGQAHGIDLTDDGGSGNGNGSVPPIGPEGVMTPDGPPPAPNPGKLSPFPFRLPGKLESFFDSLNNAVPWIAMKRQWMTSTDKLHNTKLFSKVYQPTQVAALKALAVTRELMVPLTKIEKKAKGLSLERRAVIARYRQTMSPEEMIAGLFDRPLNNNEIALAKHFAGTQDGVSVNIDAVYDYLRDAKKLNDEYAKLINQLEGEAQVAGQQLEPERIQQQIDKKESEILQLQELHGLTAKDLEAAKDFELIKRQNLNDMSLYGITELAKAIMEDRPTRAKFAEENKMTAKELEIATDFDNLYSTLADIFGIDKTRRISGFMNHYRRHGEMPHVPAEKPLAGRKSATKFLSDLIRSGEIYDYIDDPFHAAAAYIRSGVNGRILNQVWADARIAAKGEIAKMPTGARQQASNVLDEYFNEIKGIPGASDNAMQVAFDTFMTKIGRRTSKKVRGDIVNGILSTIGASTLGFKPELGIRDLGSWFGIHGSRFGFSRSLRALRYAFEKDKDGISVADKMLREGHFPGLSPIGVQSAAELAAIEHGTGIGGRIAKFGETAGEYGLKVSLQKNFYAKMHAGAYLEASRRATKLLQDFRDGKITREQAYNRMGLHTYENPVATHFDELVINSKDADAAHFLGLATAVETNFFHGLSNHPYKWGTNVGRIAGQFGQWSMFSRDYLVRLATRGTPAQRAAAITRFAIVKTAISGTGRLLGFNMRAWQILPGLAFTGGPMVQVMADNIAMTGALGTRKQKEAIGMFWNQHTSAGGFRSMFVPGSYAFHDVLEAYAASQEGYGLIPVVGRGFGFKIDYTQRSFMDEFTGNYPKIRREKPLTTYLQDKVDKTFR